MSETYESKHVEQTPFIRLLCSSPIDNSMWEHWDGGGDVPHWDGGGDALYTSFIKRLNPHAAKIMSAAFDTMSAAVLSPEPKEYQENS